jgi:glycosyltransferase involved in cell wall biosynthesis
MKAVIDCRITYNSDAALSIFTSEFWYDMALLKPHHEFIFLTDEKKTPGLPGNNIFIRKLTRTGIKWLDQKQLNKSLLAWQADRFITIEDIGFGIHNFSSGKRIKKNNAPADQLLLIAGNAEEQPKKKDLPAPVITIIKPACRTIVTELSWAEVESLKTQYTGGRSFFLFTGSIDEQHQLVELLKAFSIFKKWQQSNMQLVIAGCTTAWTQTFEEKLLHYKYGSDVVLIKDAGSAEMAKLMAACYAVVYPVVKIVFPFAVILAVQSNKAIIASDNYINRQITNAAEWVDKNNTAEGFGKAMILLYKDEKHQQLLVQQTREPAKQLNRQQMLEQVWQCIEK